MLRFLRRDRGFHLAVVLLLALGIGANTVVFSLADALLLQPLAVRDPENLYLLEENQVKQVRPGTFFPYDYLPELVAKSPMVAAAVAEQGLDSQAMVAFRLGDAARLITTQMVSPNYFRELGVCPLLGRVLDESDASATGRLPAVLSYQFWLSQFGGDRAVLGRTILLKDVPFTVAGILPREFRGSDADRAPDVRLPISARVPLFGPGFHPAFQILLRLRPGASAAAVASALLPGSRALDERALRENNRRRERPLSAPELENEIASWNDWLSLEPIARGVSRMRTQFAGAVWLLLGGVGLLLLAVCANVAGLLLARAGARRKEIGIRLAVGASRWRIVRQLLAENLLLGAAGATLAAVFARAAAPRLIGLLPPVRDFGQYATPQLLAASPDWRVLLFLAGIALGAALASAVAPAWRASRLDLAAAMKSHLAAGGTAGLVPVALQVVFCTVLLCAAGLSLRTLWNLDRLDPGFDRDHIISFTFDPAAAGYRQPQSDAFYRDLRRRAARVPGVRATAYSRWV